jgi:hypothetical protein
MNKIGGQVVTGVTVTAEVSMKRTTCLLSSSLMLLLAAPALAQQWPAADPSYGATDPTMASGPEMFGAPGQMVISSSFDFDFRYISQSFMNNSVSATELVISPDLLFFLAPNLAVGGLVSFDYISGENDFSQTGLSLGPALAYNFWISPKGSLFPTVAVLYTRVSQELRTATGKMSSSGYDVSLLLRIPVLFHPFQHVFVGVTPFTEIDFVAKEEGMDTSKTRTFGLTLDIGFWL